jgi:hypothetical protein
MAAKRRGHGDDSIYFDQTNVRWGGGHGVSSPRAPTPALWHLGAGWPHPELSLPDPSQF